HGAQAGPVGRVVEDRNTSLRLVSDEDRLTVRTDGDPKRLRRQLVAIGTALTLLVAQAVIGVTTRLRLGLTTVEDWPLSEHVVVRVGPVQRGIAADGHHDASPALLVASNEANIGNERIDHRGRSQEPGAVQG